MMGNPNVRNLAYLQSFNELTNFMVNYYSFKISSESTKENFAR